MTDVVPTVKIKDQNGEIAVINASDYYANPENYTLATETAPLKPLDPTSVPTIFGSTIQPSSWTLADGKVVHLNDIEADAYTRSGLTVEGWNALTQDDREKRISNVVSEVIPVVPNFKVKKKRNSKGEFKFFVVDNAGKVIGEEFESEDDARAQLDLLEGK